jgi:hypothetical protein
MAENVSSKLDLGAEFAAVARSIRREKAHGHLQVCRETTEHFFAGRSTSTDLIKVVGPIHEGEEAGRVGKIIADLKHRVPNTVLKVGVIDPRQGAVPPSFIRRNNSRDQPMSRGRTANSSDGAILDTMGARQMLIRHAPVSYDEAPAWRILRVPGLGHWPFPDSIWHPFPDVEQPLDAHKNWSSKRWSEVPADARQVHIQSLQQHLTRLADYVNPAVTGDIQLIVHREEWQGGAGDNLSEGIKLHGNAPRELLPRLLRVVHQVSRLQVQQLTITNCWLLLSALGILTTSSTRWSSTRMCG